jgi:flagellar hook assembly protein FlgD
VDKDDPTIPKEPLLQAYPNPFNATTNIQVRLPQGSVGGEVTMKIYNMLGQVVKTFDVSQLSETKYNRVLWDGRNDHNAAVSSGVYYFVLTTTKGRYTLKLMMVK